MPRFPGILDRFRRLLAPPGRPAETLGVPAAGDDVAAELGPLLDELDAFGAEAARGPRWWTGGLGGPCVRPPC